MKLAVNNNKQKKAEILVVDDTPDNLCLLIRILRKNGYKVRAITNGESALEVAKTSQPDLILLDIIMPSLDGYEVCRQLKAEPQTNEIPVIFLSTLNEGLDIAKAFQVGGADYITKPFQIEEVQARVYNQLNQRFLQKIVQQQIKLLHQQNRQLQAEMAESRLLQQRLFTAEQKMRAVFAAMTDIVIVINTNEGQIGNVEIIPTRSEDSCKFDAEIVSKTVEQLFHPETAETWLSSVQQALKTRSTIQFDYQLTLDENQIWLAAAISPFRRNSVILVARDISERKQSEEALRIAEERYHSIVENAMVGIYQSTPKGRYLSANPALARIYGYSSPEELVENIQNIGEQLYIDQNRRNEFINELNTNHAVFGFESIVYRKDGKAIWISETARVVCNSAGDILCYEGIVAEITEHKVAEEALKFQQAQSEELLLSILPQPIAERLHAGETLIADQFEDVSVMFADLVGFTHFSTQKSPTEIVEFLDKIFSKFDQLAQKHGLEKIKTIGDAYMVVGGLPIPCFNHTQKIAQMALDMQEIMTQFNTKTGKAFQLRIGINTGDVVAGVIGMSKFSYDLWGDTVNIASRMESSGLPGKIQVTAATYERLQEKFEFEKRGNIAVKGKGQMSTYWLISKKR